MGTLTWSKRTVFALTAMTVGVLLLSAVALYIYLDLRSGSDADKFRVSIPPDEVSSYTGQTAPPPTPGPLTKSEFSALVGLYPGNRINPKFWDTPQFAGSTPFGAPGIPANFEPADSVHTLQGLDPTLVATHISIPAINLSSSVKPLQILDLGDSAQYQTPDNTVGFIPQTSAPAQAHTGWYFGHLEGFVSGEGSVFRHLPDIAQLIREDPVDIFITTPEAEYMYRVTSTKQIPKADLAIYDNGKNDVVLVTCWPSRVYDQRVVVTADLIAVRRINGAQG